ncbi:MAG: pseudouridine-5'-phosphate glycosidase [Chloroflexota bacterium]
MNQLRFEPGVAEALASGRPVVALESALITHGFSFPANLHIAQRMEDAVRQQGALPALVAVIDGEPRIGLTSAELAHLASTGRERHAEDLPPSRKISLRDLPLALAQGMSGGTTVAATMHLARLAGIQVFATGGIGGVHRHHPEDVSADLTALGSIPITVVCSGAKAILDLPRTREILETRGVPVVGYRTAVFPAFYSRESSLNVDAAVRTPREVALLAAARTTLDLSAALLVCVPVPQEQELPAPQAEAVIDRALDEAAAAGVSGSDLTPFLLTRIVELTGGRAQRANQALLVNNARVAADIARALARTYPPGTAHP